MDELKDPRARLKVFLFCLVSALPLCVLHTLGTIVGRLLCLFENRNKRIALINLSLCFPQLNKTAQRKLLCNSLQENAKTMLETFWLWKHPHKALDKHLGKIKNEQLLVRSNNSKKGTIFITPHFGSWEFIGLLTAKYCNLWIIYAPSKSHYIDQLSRKGRTSTGAKIVSTTELNLKSLIQHLKTGGSVGILPDQVPDGKGGVYAEFFHRKAYTSTLACKLAEKLKCHVVLGYAIRNTKHPKQYDSYYFDAPQDIYSEDIKKAVYSMNQCIEKFVLNSPEKLHLEL